MAQQDFSIGIGVDTHRLAPGETLILGGVTIPHEQGLVGHSDGDVLTHAIMDALLGAADKGDLGDHFPSSDASYKGVESIALLKQVLTVLGKERLRPMQVDAVVLAEKPALSSYRAAIKASLGHALPGCKVSVKFTTTDGLGFVGREEGISAQAVALVKHL